MASWVVIAVDPEVTEAELTEVEVTWVVHSLLLVETDIAPVVRARLCLRRTQRSPRSNSRHWPRVAV